jgi:hypothetical protein
MAEKKPVAELDPQFALLERASRYAPIALPLRHSTIVKQCNGRAAVQ